jgi:hypothetical protein
MRSREIVEGTESEQVSVIIITILLRRYLRCTLLGEKVSADKYMSYHDDVCGSEDLETSWQGLQCDGATGLAMNTVKYYMVHITPNAVPTQ